MRELLAQARALERGGEPLLAGGDLLRSLDPKELLFEKARELSELLAQCDELVEYVRAETAMLNHPETVAARERLDRAEHAVKAARGKGGDGEDLLKEMYLARARWQKDPRVAAYRAAQRRLEALLNSLNAIITYPITGDDRPAMGGGCGRGGGCGGGGG